MKFPPRARYISEFPQLSAHHPLSFDPLVMDSMPKEVRSLTGNILSAVPMKQDGPTLVLLVKSELGIFVLKVAEGTYRSQELWAEHTAMELLHGGDVPVPETLLYTCSGDASFLLRRYVSGESLNAVLDASENARMNAIWQMGRLLASIHAVAPASDWSWESWISASLALATSNMDADALDPNEFAPGEPPSTSLDWLSANRPSTGSVCLLHGDYRPKNILWENGKITGVIDWQFVDVGDPYYDLSVIHWYMRGETEWKHLLNAYGLDGFDRERLQYCLTLQKFVNV